MTEDQSPAQAAKEKRLARSRQTEADMYAARGYEVSHSITVNGRHVVPGTEVHIRGLRGRYLFVKHVKTPAGIEWVDFIGPNGGGFCSFYPEQIKTVHRINKEAPGA